MSDGQETQEGRAMTILDVGLYVAALLAVLLAVDGLLVGVLTLFRWYGR